MQCQKILILSSIVIGFLAILWMIVCTLLEERLPSVPLKPKEGYIFDYVVVGAGSAGSVVASLLAKHSNSTVLLIEAGDRFGFLSKIPLLTTFQQKGLNDWAFLSQPQKHSSRGLEEQRQCLPRGKGLGGSAQLNYMLHFDGHEGDFETWSNHYNLSEWHWEAVQPFLQAAKAKTPNELLEIERRYSKLSEALSQAESEFIHKPWLFRPARYNIKNGLRHSVYQRFLVPNLKNSNLRIMTNTMAKSIELVEGTSARDGLSHYVKSLRVSVKGEETRKEHNFLIGIRRELIISAGAYQTPQFLLISGIGDANTLHQLGLNSSKHLPRVGKNLHDHINQPLYVSIDVIGPTLNQRALLQPLTWFNYLQSGTGHLGNFGVLGHIDSVFEDHYGLTFFGAGAIDESALMSISNFKRSHFRALFPRYYNVSQEGFVVISACLQPKSRGSVTIGSANVRKNPLIDPNYLSESEDVKCTIRAIRSAVEVVTSESFAPLRPRIHWPRIKECANFGPFERDFQLNTPSDRYLECVIRHVALGSHHPGGTCAMGSSAENSVVDSHFRVHGIRNLRIVDASVLPTPISGNPNSIIVGMAVRGATMILKEELSGDLLKEHLDLK